MSVLNPSSSSGDESPECPLCLEYLELDDINFYPCSCSYQICRFCWNKIRTEANGLCPACRTPYGEDPADFKPLTPEELAKIKAEKRLKDQAKKQKISENRKHLSNVRVVQKNLVFVVGLPPRIASDSDSLKKPEYFGRFGKIHKVVINSSNSYAGNAHQGPSASAYVTYLKSEDALRAIQAVNNKIMDGRTLKASLGTTKYCSHFMKNQSCPKQDCMYLHELGDEAASFTKEEMQQGKHTDYEKSLHEEIQNNIQILNHSESPSLASGTDKSSLLSSSASSSSSRDEPKSPSPKENWPNLSLRSSTSYQDCENMNHRIRESLLPSYERDTPEETISNNGVSSTSSSKANENNFFEDSLMNSRSLVDHHHHHLHGTSNSNNKNNLDGCNFNGDHREWSPPSLTEESKDIVNHSTDDEDVEEEDELGFDPFIETQKALAEMLESESKQQLYHQERSNTVVEEPQMSHVTSQQQHQYHHHSPSFSSARSKLPPPGFNMVNPTSSGSNSASSNNTTSHDIHSYLPGSIDNNLSSSSSTATSSQFTPSGFLNGGGDYGGGYRGTHHHLSSSSHYNQTSNNTVHENLLRNGVGEKLSNNYHGNNKDWQDGLRALLPNISVSFGTLPTSSSYQQQPIHHHHHHHSSLGSSEHQVAVNGGNNNTNQHKYSSHNERIQQQQQQQQTQHRSGWNNISPNDWTVLDPAIVGGQLADSRAESPPNWIKANLEQLTTEPSPLSSYGVGGSSSSSLLPGFENLGLSSSSSVGGGLHHPNHHHHHHYSNVQTRSGGLNQQQIHSSWGQSTPPPGFSRAPLQNQYANTMGGSEAAAGGGGHQIESTYG